MSDPWIAEVDAALRRRIADADAQPDFLDVVARARALDPEAFDDEALQQAEALQRAHADAPALDDGPLDATCGCPVCARWSRGYLRHLLLVAEPTAARHLTVHNVWWLLRLVESARAAVFAGTVDDLIREVRASWN